jgi:hypothetical protein
MRSVRVVVALVAALAAAPLAAQQVPPAPAVATPVGQPQQIPPPPKPAPPAPTPVPGQRPGTTPPAPAAPRPESVPTQNVRVEIAISDSISQGAAPGRKTVTMLVADGRSGRVRSMNNVRTPEAGSQVITINVDARPLVRADGRIQLDLTLEYVPDVPLIISGTPSSRPTVPATVNESLTVLLADGKPTVISQSADPSTDRKVTVEVTATVVK